jgi:phage gp45-like
MNRNSLLEMSGRAMHQMVRFTLNKGNDNPMMQELHFDGMNSDGRDKVERMQNYGFSSTPLPRDEGGDQTPPGGSSGGGAVGDKIGEILGQAAEGLCMFVGGQRNHPVCIGVDDRRHRPMGLKPGENAQYDDIGQMTLLRRAFTAILSLDSKDEKTGKMVERFVSLRHVQKEK